MKYRNPSIGYPGGKNKIAGKIIDEMPPHKTYVEPFSGAAHVFFKKPKAERNVLNDLNPNLIKFYKKIQGKKICCDIKDNRKKFNEIASKKNKSICDILYLNRTAYASKGVFGGGISYANRKKKIDVKTCIDGSSLSDVTLLSKDFKNIVKKYDSKNTLFYVDPPYVQANKKTCLYGKGFCSVTPNEVASTLNHIKGKALVSYDNDPSTKKAFKSWKCKHINFKYNMKKEDQPNELLCKNF